MKKNFLLTFALLALVASSKCFAVDPAFIVKEWERAKAFTLEYLEAMPAEKYGYKPTPEIRSFEQQLLHLADANFGFTAGITGTASPVERGGAEKSAGKSKEVTVKMVSDSYDFVINALKGMTAAQMAETVSLFGMDMTREVAFGKAFEHQTHHRGQTTPYIRLAGATPPNEKLF
jgi:uncharacterized damage-inducible protein DinB